jgi:hypothetical protein
MAFRPVSVLLESKPVPQPPAQRDGEASEKIAIAHVDQSGTEPVPEHENRRRAAM